MSFLSWIGGHVDNSVKLVSPDGAKTLESAYGHCSPVTCLALSPDSNYLVTGSRDTTVILWKVHRLSRSSSNLDPSTSSGTPNSNSSSNLRNLLNDRSRRRRLEGPIHVLRGHRKEIVCCYVSSDLGVVVSCSPSSDVLLHSTKSGRLIKRLKDIEAHAVCLSSEGVILTWNKTQSTLQTFTLNGVPIASAHLPTHCTVSCLEISINGNNALIGLNSNPDGDSYYDNTFFQDEESDADSSEISENKLDVSSPSICLLVLHTLKVYPAK